MAQVKGITSVGGGGSSSRDYVAEAQAARNAGIAQSVKKTKAKKLYEDQVKAAHQVAYGRTTSTPTKTATSSGGTRTSGGIYTPTDPTPEPEEYYEEPYIDYEALERERLARLQAAADEAYNRNMARIADAYNSASGNLRSNYDSTVDRLNVARNSSMSDVNTDAERALQEAYINNMLTKKNLNQRLSAMGYNGGATETTMGSLDNQYGSSRAGINEVLNKNIANLNQSYGDNLAGALQSYNSAKSNLDLQRMQLENAAENARNNMQADYMTSSSFVTDPSYVNALRNVVSRQSAFTKAPVQATNNYVAGNAQQAQSAAQGTNYAKYLAQAQLAAQNGTPTSKIQQDLFNEVSRGNLGIDTLYDILGQLGAR